MVPFNRTIAGAAGILMLLVPIAAETIELRPVADTTLHAIAPAANMGGHTHVAIGTTAKNTPSRGLFRFGLGTIPTNAVITSVTLTFSLPALNRPDSSGSIYAAHRMLKAWGEGTKTGNLGAAATAGEATWQHSALPTTWGAPGGQAGVDYVADASATETLGPAPAFGSPPGPYAMQSSAALVADIQHWLAHPQENFGWLLKVQDESALQTARQFASRETAHRALLRVEHSAGTAEELLITAIEKVSTNLVIRWTGGQATIAVERAPDLPGTWQQVGESAAGAFTNSLQQPRAFFRLRKD